MPSMNITENESLNFYNIRFIFNNALLFWQMNLLAHLTRKIEIFVFSTHIIFVKMIAISIMVSNDPISKAIPTLALDIKIETMQINITTAIFSMRLTEINLLCLS